MSSSSIIKLLLLLPFTCLAQQITVQGSVKDVSGQPLPFADVFLLQVQDSTVYKKSFTDETGRFEIKGVAGGTYNLKISTIGYEEYIAPLAAEKDVALAPVVLREAPKQLEGVVVYSKRPVIKRKIDRLEFDVENSILSSQNGWEILRKTPGITMSGGSLTVRGSQGILVTINDKKVYMTGAELKDFLENTNGDDIKSIEVITTPPAKYEAQGSAVVNIKMKKNMAFGYKVAIAAAYVQTMYPKGVVSTSQYYKSNRLSLYGGYSFGSGHYFGSNKSEVKYFDDNGNVKSDWRGEEKSNYRATSQNSYNFTAEYQIDTLNTVAVGMNGFFSLKSTLIAETPTNIYDGNGTLDSLYTTRNHRDYPQKDNTLTASFEHKFNATDKLSFSSDYTNHYFNQDQAITAQFSYPDAPPHRQDNIDSDDTRDISLFSVQADYNAKKWNTNFEAGMRYGNVSADNDFDYSSAVNGVPVSNPGLSNRFMYDENIGAAYLGFDKELGKWNIKAGLRGEYTKLEGNSITIKEINKQEYFKLFPTLYGMYKLSDNHQIGASYGKRIIRPQYAFLNPFRLYATPYAYSVGDPYLQPAIAHNLGLNYTLKSKYSFDLFYRYEKDPTAEVVFQDYTTNTVVTKFTNIDKNISAGLEFNTSLQLYDWWESGINSTIGYQVNTFQAADLAMQTIERWTYYGSLNNRFVMDKAKTLLGEIDFFYMTPTVQGAYKLSGLSSLSLSAKKVFMKGRAEVSISLSDIYKGLQQTSSTQYANQYSRFKTYGDTQEFRIRFRYRFGNQKLNGEKNKQTTDEQNRL